MTASVWEKYQCVIPPKHSFSAGNGEKLKTISHIAHVPAARRIIQDGRIRVGLVYDESKLNKSRYCVTWLSANHWNQGSIYGSVEFRFSWDELIKGKRFYWVEDMPTYNPPAFRIFITERLFTNSKYLTPYNPTKAKGPLRKVNGEWYWSGNFTSEFMFDTDIALEQCKLFKFVQHHPTICSVDDHCNVKGEVVAVSQRRIIAHILGSDHHELDHVLRHATDANRLAHHAHESLDELIFQLRKPNAFGGAISKPASRVATMKGALALFGDGNTKDAKALLKLLKDEATFNLALKQVVANHFDFSTFKLPV